MCMRQSKLEQGKKGLKLLLNIGKHTGGTNYARSPQLITKRRKRWKLHSKSVQRGSEGQRSEGGPIPFFQFDPILTNTVDITAQFCDFNV